VLNPREQIEKLLSWVGLEMYECDIAVTNNNEKYFAIWSAERNSFISSISMAKMAQFESRMKSYGYSLNEPFTVNEVSSA
jgi:hypothetical protein